MFSLVGWIREVRVGMVDLGEVEAGACNTIKIH